MVRHDARPSAVTAKPKRGISYKTEEEEKARTEKNMY